MSLQGLCECSPLTVECIFDSWIYISWIALSCRGDHIIKKDFRKGFAEYLSLVKLHRQIQVHYWNQGRLNRESVKARPFRAGEVETRVRSELIGQHDGAEAIGDLAPILRRIGSRASQVTYD